MKQLRHGDVTMLLLQVASLFMVSLAEACHYYCQSVENVSADDKLFVHYIQKHVYQLQEVKTWYSVIC